MEKVGHRIYDGNAGTLSELDAGLVAACTRHDDFIISRKDDSDVVHGFTGRNADGLLLQKNWMAAELGHAHLEGNARAEGFFLEYQRDAFPREKRGIPEVAVLDPPGEREDRRQFLCIPESERDEIFFHCSCSGSGRGNTGGPLRVDGPDAGQPGETIVPLVTPKNGVIAGPADFRRG